MIVVAALILAVCIVGVAAWDRYGVVRRRRHAPVIVTLKSGSGFKGVLIGDDRRALVLGNVETIDDGRPMPVDGEVIVPWCDVKYVQKL